MKEEPKNVDLRILQLAHGKIIPEYISAYALRCNNYLKNFTKRCIMSVGGLVLKDTRWRYVSEYKSLLMTFKAALKGDRSFEIYISEGKYLRKKYIRDVRKLISQFDIIVFEGPWQYPLVSDLLQDKLVVYDAHNVEYTLRNGNRYQEECRRIEGDLLNRSDIVLSVTRKDIKGFADIYQVDNEKLFFAPHVVDLASFAWNGHNSNSIVFIGSVYGPNNSALDRIYQLAQKYPRYRFQIIGSARSARRWRPKNLVYHGTVDEATKDKIMSRCFLALNPVTEGSGRNVKMMDYLAHGLPILSTPMGIRGFEDYDISGSVVIADIDQFGEAIEQLSADREKIKRMSDNSRMQYENILRAEESIDPEEIILKKYQQIKSHN